MSNIDKVVDGLKRFNQIVGLDGSWVNLVEFQKAMSELPELLEHAVAARDKMADLMDRDKSGQLAS